MAVKETQKTAESDVQAEKEENVANSKTKKEETVNTLVYIGPQLPKGKLKTNKILIGTEEEIKKELAEVLEEYPLVEKMLVPVEQLAEKKDRVKTQGNILNKYYSDITASIAAKEKEA